MSEPKLCQAFAELFAELPKHGVCNKRRNMQEGKIKSQKRTLRQFGIEFADQMWDTSRKYKCDRLSTITSQFKTSLKNCTPKKRSSVIDHRDSLVDIWKVYANIAAQV